MRCIVWRWAHRAMVGVFVLMVLVGCRGWSLSRPQPEVSLTVTGRVAQGGIWDAGRLQSLGLMEVVTINPGGEEVIWGGVLLKDLLEAVQPEPGAGRVIFTDADGKRVEMSLNEARACGECLVAFDPVGGGLNLAMPGLPAELWVRNLVNIEIQ
ncbi:MAG: hypothetical protein Kow0063_28340 [Anaerolineae bacterium]